MVFYEGGLPNAPITYSFASRDTVWGRFELFYSREWMGESNMEETNNETDLSCLLRSVKAGGGRHRRTGSL